MAYQNNEGDDFSLILSDSRYTSPRTNGNNVLKMLLAITVTVLISIPLVITFVSPRLSELVIANVESTFGEKLFASENELLGAKNDLEKKNMFEEFKTKHVKKYHTDDEETFRFAVFKENMKKIDALNSVQGAARYDITKFSDLTEQEFIALNGLDLTIVNEKIGDVQDILLGGGKHKNVDLPGYVPYASMKDDLTPESELPDEYDWREHGAVTPVKDQGLCGACWAFAANGDMEGTNFLKTQNLLSLSEQFLTSCDTLDKGCSGGMMATAYEWVVTNGGVETETEYPFVSGADGSIPSCKVASQSSWPASIDGWTLIEQATDADIKSMLVSKGPISVAINANQMQFYSSGIDTAGVCNWGQPNHGVLLVGYGKDKGKDYWIIKNSWSDSWGEDGYYRIYTDNGACGIPQLPMKSL